MSDAPATLPDGTLTFLPERLNRDPAVLRGSPTTRCGSR
jgi:hypothetical protein